MTDQEFIERIPTLAETLLSGKQPSPPRIVLFGTPGIGKSTLASCAPDPVFLPTEDGLREINCVRFPLAEKYDHVINSLNQLCAEDHDRKTVVIDSVDSLEALDFTQVCEDHHVKAITDIDYGKGYAPAVWYLRQVLCRLDWLRDNKGMTVILLAHSKVERVESPGIDPYPRWTLKLNKHISAVVTEWADAVLFASYQVYTKTTEGAFGRELTQGVGSGERIIRTEERPAHVAKNRYALPYELPLSWDALETAIRTKTETQPNQTE